SRIATMVVHDSPPSFLVPRPGERIQNRWTPREGRNCHTAKTMKNRPLRDWYAYILRDRARAPPHALSPKRTGLPCSFNEGAAALMPRTRGAVRHRFAIAFPESTFRARPPPNRPHMKDIILVASGDSRLSANRVCWPAQAALEETVTRTFAALGARIVRGH